MNIDRLSWSDDQYHYAGFDPTSFSSGPPGMPSTGGEALLPTALAYDGNPAPSGAFFMPAFLPQLASAAPASKASTPPPFFPSVDDALYGPQARQAFGVDGTGIKVGIISDSFDQLGTGSNAASDEASGALPSAANVHILQDGYAGQPMDDEGRAMAQVVHSIAPGAQIYFYSAGGNQANFATAVTALQQQGCQIIVDDESGADEPFYQTGSTVDRAIDAAVAAGTTYFTAAGNMGTSYYEASFSPISVTLPVGTFGSVLAVTAHNFGTAANPTPYESLTIPSGGQIDVELQWNQPFGTIGSTGATSDLNFYLFRDDPTGRTLVASGTAPVLGGNPIQISGFAHTSDSTSYELAVVLASGTAPSLFKVVIEDSTDTVTINDPAAGAGSGSIFGHALDPNAITVGAAYYFTATTGTENYTSKGPGELFYDSNGNALSAPVSAGKPDVTAPDGGPTTVSGIEQFFGTSAAAPAAAAVGALMLQVNPELDPADISNLMKDSATAMPDPAASGAGLVNADAAVGMAKTLQIQMPYYTSTVLGTHLGDTFLGAAGNHTIDGVGGTNTLDYAAAPVAVTVDIQGGSAANGFGGYDSFTNIQNVDGSAFNDTFGAAPGVHTVNGEGGHDTMLFAGAAAAFSITNGTNGVVTVANSVTTMNTIDIEFLQFSDQTTFVENANIANVAALYSAALGRAPDIAGLEGWEDIYLNDLSASVRAKSPFVSLAESVPTGLFASIADGFTQSAEFKQKYGSLTDTGFVTQLYEDVLDRAPDQGGLNSWLTLMHQGDSTGQIYSRDMVLVGIASSPENLTKVESSWLHIV